MRLKILKDNQNDLKELTDFLDSHGKTNYVIKGNKVVYNDTLDLSQRKIRALPESFGNLEINGYLDLERNQLTSLPESFGNLEINGYLYLRDNKFTSLPSSILKIPLDKLLLDDQTKEIYNALKEWED